MIGRINQWLKLNGAPDEMTAERAPPLGRQLPPLHRHRAGREGGGRPRDHRRGAQAQSGLDAGHTNGHICLYDAERSALMTGDHVLDPISPNVSLAREYQGNPLGQYLQSLRKVAELDADLVLPAHGDPFRDISRRVRELWPTTTSARPRCWRRSATASGRATRWRRAALDPPPADASPICSSASSGWR